MTLATYRLRPLHGPEGHALISLGASRWPLFLATGVLWSGLVLLPFSTMIGQALSTSSLRDALARGGDSLLRSLLYAAWGATLLTLLGFLLGYLMHSRALPISQSADSLSLFLFALRSAVIGVGMSALWNRPSTGFIYGTWAIIALGYVTHNPDEGSEIGTRQVPIAAGGARD